MDASSLAGSSPPTAHLTPTLAIGAGHPMAVIAGPCVIESEEFAVSLATTLQQEAAAFGVPLVFKASYDKANRSSLTSFRGPGLHRGLAALAAVKRATGLPLLTDVHEPAQAEAAAEVVDVLQIPAFLCRQTDLLLACGRSGRAVNIKKGQFMAPHDMGNAVAKVRSTGNPNVTLTERGASFGYNNLVVDMRALPSMRRFAPVVFDVTHSLQLPGGLGHATGGAREYHRHLARAAVAAGVDALFVEVHPDPPRALSDASTQLSLVEFRTLLAHVVAVRAAVESLDD